LMNRPLCTCNPVYAWTHNTMSVCVKPNAV